jgi:hypothetical protein
MTAIRASLERDYRSIAEQSIPNTSAKQVLSRTLAASRRFLVSLNFGARAHAATKR